MRQARGRHRGRVVVCGRGIWSAAVMTLRACRWCSRLEGGLKLVQAVMVASMGGGGWEWSGNRKK